MSPYQAGYTEGANDFSLGVFHQGKLTDFDGGHSGTFGNGYVDGRRASCFKAHQKRTRRPKMAVNFQWMLVIHEDNNSKSFNHKPNDRRAVWLCTTWSSTILDKLW